ncbi:MAG TPA: Crp/Fnr family transcriptional regulator [Terriglobales bacterium]|nr:Crp/Fnr family transcriptional regulator [Terriglobales bacterium]
MLSPYGLDIIESCLTCKIRAEPLFCHVPAPALQAFETIKCASAYPKGTVLFMEGQIPRGIFVVCQGTVKLSACATHGRTLILKLTEPGEVLGLSDALSGNRYEFTAETIQPSQVNFVKRGDFLCFLKQFPQVCFKVVETLSEKYNRVWQEIRSFGLSHSAGERLAKLLVQWGSKNGQWDQQEPRIKLAITHEEIGQIIGASRETVTRAFAQLRKQQIVHLKGATLVVHNKAALKRIANS